MSESVSRRDFVKAGAALAPAVLSAQNVNSELAVGWIGTGVMGASMCRHLQAAHYRLTLFTRNRSKASAILAKGATWADSPRAVAEQTFAKGTTWDPDWSQVLALGQRAEAAKQRGRKMAAAMERLLAGVSAGGDRPIEPIWRRA